MIRPICVPSTGRPSRWHAAKRPKHGVQDIEKSRVDVKLAASAAPPLADSTGSPRPHGPITIGMLFMPGVYERVNDWLERAGRAMVQLRSGARPDNPGTVIVQQHEMQLWARGIIWDTRDPQNCVPVERSDRSTIFPGKKQLDRTALRVVAQQLGWADRDLLVQLGEGGIETRSQCGLDTVLSWHHAGLVEHFEAAAKVIDAEIAADWVTTPTAHLPFVPCRVIPRNVVLQERQRLRDDGSLESFMKPRITTNLSANPASTVAINEGVHGFDRSTVLPTNRDLGLAAMIVDDIASTSGHQAEFYALDLEAAFRFVVMQRADWWQLCFLWVDEHGRAGVSIDTRMCFGGAFAPNRFERLAALIVAAIQTEQATFDTEHPVPAQMQRALAARQAAQAAGELPFGVAQTAARYLHAFIDDITGVASNDPVDIDDTELPPVDLGEAPSAAAGGVAAQRGSRVDAHTRIAVRMLIRLGAGVTASKTQSGRVIVSLGLLLSLIERTMRCPQSKRGVLLAEISDLLTAVLEGRAFKRSRVETLVGRLVNLSQALPELAPHLAAGYRVANAPVPRLTLKRTGRCARAFTALLEVARQILETNEGVQLAPRQHFQETHEAGVLTVVTDASGEDGVGGYAFHADLPGTVFIMSSAWPPDIATAIAANMRRRVVRDASDAKLPMPAGELFGAWAMVAAVVEQGARVSAAISVTDCAPASDAINAAGSASAVMQSLIRSSRAEVAQWLGVHVHRELNADADVLSHPTRADEVVERAKRAGLNVRRGTILDVPERCWTALRAAVREAAEGWEW